jgi:hypothetical protein
MESTQSLHREASQSTLSVHVEPKHESASTVTPLLDADDATLVPEGWPTSPSRIKRPLYAIILDGAFDIALLAFSACFLVFSLVVMFYDGRSTSKSPTATSVLTRATKYVRLYAQRKNYMGTNTMKRVLPSSHSSSPPSLGEQLMQYSFGGWKRANGFKSSTRWLQAHHSQVQLSHRSNSAKSMS